LLFLGDAMTLYAFITNNGVVVNTLEIDDSVTDISPFLESQKVVFENTNLSAIDGSNKPLCSIGNIYNGSEFRTPQPYPSWIWDEAKLVWRAPAMHPDAWPDGIIGGDAGDYTWNEEEQVWKPKA